MQYTLPSFLLLLFCSMGSLLLAQRNYDLHWVAFKDKANTPYSLFKPHEYLSHKALWRRAKQEILIDSSDLPVNKNYVQLLEKEGLKIHATSRWFNGAIVIGQWADVEKALTQHKDIFIDAQSIGFYREPNRYLYPNRITVDTNYKKINDFYGAGSNQIKMLNGHYLHGLGFQGQALDIAIFDAGFPEMRETPAFYTAFNENRILGTFDLVEGDTFVYDEDSHGRNVLSTIAADLPHLFVGTAPKANYYLMRTEDNQSELIAEEYFWLLAAELADSLGVDVINSSLGYATFDDKKMNHAYVEIDGKTVPISRAAKFAAEKGILVVTSAGNSGQDKWKHITPPADVETVLTVGAVDREEKYAKFSSHGFDTQPYIKPDVSARGASTIIAAAESYDTRYASGTSFSSPIIAGMTASLWQALPHLSAQDIIYKLRMNSSKSNNPDYFVGYGVPNYYKIYKDNAQNLLEIDFLKANDWIQNTPFKLQDKLELIFVNLPLYDNIQVRISDAIGTILHQENLAVKDRDFTPFIFLGKGVWSKGVYLLEITYKGEVKRLKLVY